MKRKGTIVFSLFLIQSFCLNEHFVKSQQANGQLKPITHAIFDLDGTLIDTESMYKDAANAVTTRYGKKFTWKDKSRLLSNLKRDAPNIVKVFGLPLTGEQFYDEVMKVASEMITNVPFLPGAEKVVTYFRNNSIPLALCTGSTNNSFHMKTDQFGDFFKLGVNFDIIVLVGSDHEINRVKPDPQPYLVTISRFPSKPKPENVIVFEDSYDGVTSAIDAGTKCVMIPDSRVDSGNATSRATVILNSFTDFDPTLFGLPPME